MRLPGGDVGPELHAQVAGGAAVLCDPHARRRLPMPSSMPVGTGADRLKDSGFRRAGQFTWLAVATATLDVYREVAERRRHRGT